MSDSPVTGEVSNSKLAAVFGSEAAARAGAAAVLGQAGLEAAQVLVITPDEPHPGLKMEPEVRGIRRTIVRAHVRLGIAGLVVGAIAFAIALWLQVPAIALSPWTAGTVMVAFGGVAGLMLGGLVALRPDHDGYIQATRDAIQQRRTTVVVHALSAEQRDRATAVLAGLGAEITHTL